ncbi:hypothetical protein DYQ86_19150 [Acidobacteria bacterium AB60]|nr:hypothetical protein DYQ86_19150 [Acidobacteria bacterium AB60]
MSNIARYLSAEKYVGIRILFVVSVGVVVLGTAALAFAKGLLSPRALGLAMIAYAACATGAVFVTLRNAGVGLQGSSSEGPEIAEDGARKKFRRRIRKLQVSVAFFAIVLLYGLWQTRGGPWAPRLVGATVNILLQIVMIQAIRRMQRQLKQGDSSRHE